MNAYNGIMVHMTFLGWHDFVIYPLSCTEQENYQMGNPGREVKGGRGGGCTKTLVAQYYVELP